MNKVDFCSFWWAFRVDRFVFGPVHLLLWFVVPVFRWIRAVLPDGRIIVTVVTGASLTPGGVAGARIAVLEPNAQADVSLHQIADQENIEIRNDTHLYLTAKMTDLSENGGGNLTGYAAATIAGIYGPEILGPQSGPLLAYASTDKKFIQPAGRNARVWVMTPGYQESIVGLSEPEKELRKVLRVRTYCDQFIIPAIGLVVGLKAKEASELAKAISGALFTHHLKLVEDLGAFVRAGDFTGFSQLLWRFTLREIETVGPLAKAAALVLGESLESLLTKRLGEDWVKRFVPFAGQVKEGIDWGARGLTMRKFLKTFDDLKGTPGKLEFFVYFEPGKSPLRRWW